MLSLHYSSAELSFTLLCSARRMGYTWEPEIALPITKALALYPVGESFAGFVNALFLLTPPPYHLLYRHRHHIALASIS
jgi:hypothetical protein